MKGNSSLRGQKRAKHNRTYINNNLSILLSNNDNNKAPLCADINTATLSKKRTLFEGEKQTKPPQIHAIRIQRFYRAYLHKRYRRAFLQAQIINEMIMFKSSALIQTMARVYFAKRRIVVERCLRVIRTARPQITRWALSSEHVFWYDDARDTRLLFKDYYAFVKRTRHRPSLYVVEENIKIIAKRIQSREFQLAQRVQSRWRGIFVRSYFPIFLREVIRIREIRVNAVLKIQPFVRAWLDRYKVRRMRFRNWRWNVREAYNREIQANRYKKRIQRKQDILKHLYRKERHVDRTMNYLKQRALSHSSENLPNKENETIIYINPYTHKSLNAATKLVSSLTMKEID